MKKTMKCECQLPHKQSGTVLITVILIAAFVIILVIESVKTVRYQKQLSSNIINRDQAYSYLMGMEELAKIWLKKSFETSKEDTVHLNQSWAQDNITFPIDGGLMTASIKDMQSCFNLNSITLKSTQPVGQNNAQAGGKNPTTSKGSANQTPQRVSDAASTSAGQEIYSELLSKAIENSEVSSDELAISLKDWMDEDSEPSDHRGAEDDYYLGMEIPYRAANGPLAHTSELLTVKGYSQASYQQILPYVCVLPEENADQLNVNTITEDQALLLHAALGEKDISLTDVTQALSNRGESGFESIDEFQSEFGEKQIPAEFKRRLGVTSEYFQITAQAEIGNTKVAMRSLFKRDQENNFKVVSRYYGKDMATVANSRQTSSKSDSNANKANETNNRDQPQPDKRQ